MKVWIPTPLQVYSHGNVVVEASASNLRRLIHMLDETCPGIKDALIDGDKLRPGVAIAMDGQISQLGLLQPLKDVKEVAIIPAISGG